MATGTSLSYRLHGGPAIPLGTTTLTDIPYIMGADFEGNPRWILAVEKHVCMTNMGMWVLTGQCLGFDLAPILRNKGLRRGVLVTVGQEIGFADC